jgi:hypothetical protein
LSFFFFMQPYTNTLPHEPVSSCLTPLATSPWRILSLFFLKKKKIISLFSFFSLSFLPAYTHADAVSKKQWGCEQSSSWLLSAQTYKRVLTKIQQKSSQKMGCQSIKGEKRVVLLHVYITTLQVTIWVLYSIL